MSDPTDIKVKVRDLLRTGLPDFEVTWNFTTKNPPNHWCYLGDTSWPEAEWATNRSRQYEMSIPIILNVLKVRKSPEEVERYLGDHLAIIEGIFSNTSDLRDTGVISWSLHPRQLGVQPAADGRIEGQAAFELRATYRP